MNPHVSIVMLNWNRHEDTIACLESLFQISYEPYSVVLVDNASTDDSVGKIREYADGKPFKLLEPTRQTALPSPPWLTLIVSQENTGFTGGNNTGSRYAMEVMDPGYLLFLNSDTVVERDFLTRLIEAAQADVRVGSAQSLLLRPGGETVDSLGIELTAHCPEDRGAGTPVKRHDLSKNRPIFGPCCAAALYKTEVLRETGLFDPRFFAIFEDVDLAWKTRLAGYESVLVVDSLVYHRRGVSEHASRHPPEKYRFKRNLMMLHLRYHPLRTMTRWACSAPHRCLAFLLGLGFSMIRTWNWRDFFDAFASSMKIRKTAARNPEWKEIPRQWIERV